MTWRGFLEAAFGLVSFAVLVYLFIGRMQRSASAQEYLFWLQYFMVRATLAGLMVYAGVVSYRDSTRELFGLQLGLGFASVALGALNVLEYIFAKGDWKDALSAVLYLPFGFALLLTTWYIRSSDGPAERRDH
jgi:CDP-diglyceride synthetase